MLIVTHRQESLSRAYVQAVASKCGLNCSFREFDYGIDVTLHEIRRRGNRYVESGFKLDIQAKSSINAIYEESCIKYDLEMKNYDDLRDPEVGTPRILVLLALPTEELNWASFTEESLTVKKCAYWLSLKGYAHSDNNETIRISLPRLNRFNAESLSYIMERIRTGDDI